MNSVRAENATELNRKMQEIMKEKNNETLIGGNFSTRMKLEESL